jgi:hypothetical protein
LLTRSTRVSAANLLSFSRPTYSKSGSKAQRTAHRSLRTRGMRKKRPYFAQIAVNPAKNRAISSCRSPAPSPNPYQPAIMPGAPGLDLETGESTKVISSPHQPANLPSRASAANLIASPAPVLPQGAKENSPGCSAAEPWETGQSVSPTSRRDRMKNLLSQQDDKSSQPHPPL